MSELTEFLLARIAEDEAVARAATAGPWRWDNDEFDGEPAGSCKHNNEWTDHGPDLVTVELVKESWGLSPAAVILSASGYDASSVNITRPNAEHIALHNPARVLAECKAKERVVAHLLNAIRDEQRAERRVPHDEEQEFAALRARQSVECIALDIADIYADHPDYDQDWRP